VPIFVGCHEIILVPQPTHFLRSTLYNVAGVPNPDRHGFEDGGHSVSQGTVDGIPGSRGLALTNRNGSMGDIGCSRVTNDPTDVDHVGELVIGMKIEDIPHGQSSAEITIYNVLFIGLVGGTECVGRLLGVLWYP
jgi:hypothetical protein